jgi:hypothetical protein
VTWRDDLEGEGTAASGMAVPNIAFADAVRELERT